MRSKRKTKENLEKNREKHKEQIVSKESENPPGRRVSFAATARIRVFNTGDSTSEQETPNEREKEKHNFDKNPFSNDERSMRREIEPRIRKKTKTNLSSPLVTSFDRKEMDMTACVGGIIDKTQKDSFVEQLSPIIVTKELPERLSWCFNPTETMNITDNVGKILKEENNESIELKEDDRIPLIKDIPEPVFEQMNSPFTGMQSEKTPKKEDETRRRSSIRYSVGSRLDGYPTPLFPKIRVTEQSKVKVPSPCIEETQPEITIKDFLSLVGIRFLDGLTSFTRRDTLLFDKKIEEEVDSSGLVHRGLVCTEEHAIYERGCSEIIELISESRNKVDCLEKEFGFNRPTVYSQFNNGDEFKKEEIAMKLKSLKSTSRIDAKKSWYCWRMTHCSALKECFDGLFNLIEHETNEINKKVELIEECDSEIEAVLLQTTAELISLREKEEAYHTMDWTRFRELEVLVEKQKTEIEEHERKAQKMKEEADVVDLLVKEEIERESKLESELEECYELCKSYEETSSSIIEKIEFGYNVLEFVCGWRLTQLSKTQIKVSTTGDIPVDLTVDYAVGFVYTKIEIQTTHQDNFTHKCVSILKEESSSFTTYVPEFLCSVLKRLDGWSLLRKDLKNARFLSLISDKTDPKKHAYNATLLQGCFRRRVDVLFDATEYPAINILSTKTVYGALFEEEKVSSLYEKIKNDTKNKNAVVTSFLRLLLTIK